jgi:NADH-quinone oxidoreductase subunit J
MIAAVAFYVFAAVLLASAAMVVSARNPVHAVLFLILAFFNAGALFLLAGAEFLAMILVIVYVGAVAVLFLFVVMMLDVDFSQLREGLQRYAPVGLAIGVVLFVELAVVLSGWSYDATRVTLHLAPNPTNLNNTEALGRLVYTHYFLLFQTAGLILLVAMIGAIVLTLRDKKASRRQNIEVQTSRTMADTMEMMRLPLGAGTAALGFLRPKPPEVPPEPAHHDDHAAGGH